MTTDDSTKRCFLLFFFCFLAIFLHQLHYLRTVVILRIVNEDSALCLHVASLEVVDHPKPIVEQTLVVEVEIVGECLTVVASSV